MGAAAGRLQISYCQYAWSYKRYRAESAKGLVYISRRCPSNGAKREEIMQWDIAIHDCHVRIVTILYPSPHGGWGVFPLPY